MKTSKCQTERGSKARTAIRKVDDIKDLRVLELFCRKRRDALALEAREAKALAAWEALTEGVYVLIDGVISHHGLVVGAHYRVVPYRGRKHRGAHCYRVSADEKAIWLDWLESVRIRPVVEGEAEDGDRIDNARKFRRFTERMLG